MNYKIAIVGTKNITAGFAAIGCDIRNVNTTAEALDVMFNLKKEKQEQEPEKEKYAIIFVLEEFLKDISIDDYKKLSSGALPAIIPLPSHQGSSDFGETKIRRIVEKAVGSNIFEN